MDVVARSLGAKDEVIANVLLDEAVAVVAADHRIGQVHVFDLGLQLAAMMFADPATEDRADFVGLSDRSIGIEQSFAEVVQGESGMTQPAIAAAMGVSLSTVNRAHMAYGQGGLKALMPKPNGGRKHENMTLAEEKTLLARFAKAAGAGEMPNIHDLKAAYEKAIAHATSDSTVYNLLHRHGWRKLMPRPFHPKRDLAAQNVFLKLRVDSRSAITRLSGFAGSYRNRAYPKMAIGLIRCCALISRMLQSHLLSKVARSTLQSQKFANNQVFFPKRSPLVGTVKWMNFSYAT